MNGFQDMTMCEMQNVNGGEILEFVLGLRQAMCNRIKTTIANVTGVGNPTSPTNLILELIIRCGV